MTVAMQSPDFPDYDCRWVGTLHESNGETWSDLREQLVQDHLSPGPASLRLALLATAQPDSSVVCSLGFLTACLALHIAGKQVCEVSSLTLPLLPALATSWPLLRFLVALQDIWPARSSEHDCKGLHHPSIDWDDYFSQVHGYATEAYQEDDMESLITERLSTVVEYSTGIVWKFSSAVEYQARTIASWTAQCAFGCAVAFILRATSLVLGELDVYKMVEALLQHVEESVLNVFTLSTLLSSRWPVLRVLQKLSSMKKRHDDLSFAPQDFQVDLEEPVQAPLELPKLSARARQAAMQLLVAAPGPILITFVRSNRACFLSGYMKHARKAGFIGRLLILPQSEEVLNLCQPLDATCLPVVSVYPEVARYTVAALASRLGIDALYSDLEVYWTHNPFEAGVLPRAHKKGGAGADVYVAQEFYSNQTRPGIVLVRATERSIVAMASLATWLLRFPFSVEVPAIRYLLEPDRPAYVPSVSMLRADRHPMRGPLAISVFDAENSFVTSDGWFGQQGQIIAFELNPILHPDEKSNLLEAFYGSLQESGAAERALSQAEKLMSPKRPLQVLHESLHNRLAEPVIDPVDPSVQILHVTYAEGCCEVEKKKASDRALFFGANASRALNGSALTDDFRIRNSRLLNWKRTAELTSGKTPSGKVGYYVWKPFIILETLKDPSVPEGSVVLWTDAGVHFIAPLRPLVQRYLERSDVSATETPMMEADVTKRDAFILLDADYQSIIQTNQIATGIILARKTPLAIRFMESWLRACEDERIITELPSGMGLPDYFTFRHHNDDQSAFSLLFKKYGFHPFSQAERDEFVVAARNIAKFLAASDAFALGTSVSQDGYIAAADAAAVETQS